MSRNKRGKAKRTKDGTRVPRSTNSALVGLMRDIWLEGKFTRTNGSFLNRRTLTNISVYNCK